VRLEMKNSATRGSPVSAPSGCHLPDARGRELLGIASGHKDGQQFLAVLQVWHAHRRSPGRDWNAVAPQHSGRLRDGDVRPAERPSAPQRQVQPQTEFPRLFRCEAEHVEKLVRKIPDVVESGFGVVQRHRVDRLHLGAAHSAGLHGAQLALDLSLGDARSEPPPAHHDAGIVGRVFERPPESFHVRIGGHGQNGRRGNQNS
jgi:hypothetical protein